MLALLALSISPLAAPNNGPSLLTSATYSPPAVINRKIALCIRRQQRCRRKRHRFFVRGTSFRPAPCLTYVLLEKVQGASGESAMRTGQDPSTRHEKDRKQQMLAPSKSSQKPPVNSGDSDTKWGIFQLDQYATRWEVHPMQRSILLKTRLSDHGPIASLPVMHAPAPRFTSITEALHWLSKVVVLL